MVISNEYMMNSTGKFRSDPKMIESLLSNSTVSIINYIWGGKNQYEYITHFLNNTPYPRAMVHDTEIDDHDP